ncbi:hypothetical protein [Microvirga aerophila]|uniref:Uncharacterized protein n=1 Tax=Microvirga aerophila TaxID=670291 RepID=A0A512C1Z4_9HYPH|nr:hypothetical protein [Microvirga aerophila]GEO18213.1 hypothetical protein MAE02_59090 [Microvirga aerophila]
MLNASGKQTLVQRIGTPVHAGEEVLPAIERSVWSVSWVPAAFAFQRRPQFPQAGFNLKAVR